MPKKSNDKGCSNYYTIALILQASKVILKILQARLQQFMNGKLSDIQAGFVNGRGTKNHIANICWITEEAKEFQKKIYFCLIDHTKLFDCVDHYKLSTILKEMGYQTTLPISQETYMQVKKQQLDLDMEQQTGSKMGKDYNKPLHCYSAYLT